MPVRGLKMAKNADVGNFGTFSADFKPLTGTKTLYRLGMVNLNMVNSKFHLIQSFFEYLARFLSFHV